MKTMRNHFVVAVALLLVAGFSTGCKMASHAFPASGAITGWEKTGDTRSFNPDTLWTYIDGGADQYVNAGVVHAYTADYKFQGATDAVVDVYAMKTPEGAKKIFDADPAVGSKTVQLGDAAREYERSVVFIKGKNVVRITAYAGGTHQADALMALAQGIDSKL
jgi:hypothetical protein